MAASSAADIPESKVDYCPCNRCTVARKQGREEIIDRVRELTQEYWDTNLIPLSVYKELMELLDGIK